MLVATYKRIGRKKKKDCLKIAMRNIESYVSDLPEVTEDCIANHLYLAHTPSDCGALDIKGKAKKWQRDRAKEAQKVISDAIEDLKVVWGL